MEGCLQYGLDADNQLKYVDDVPNGKECGCRCPHCGDKLIAKHDGKKKIHHFAHDSGADCPGARMSALHLMAQQIIEESKQIMLPNYEGEYVKKDAMPVSFDRVDLEVGVDENGVNRKIDCVGTTLQNTEEHKIWIEIKVTHEVDDAKKQDIHSLQQACIEIDLLNILDTNYTKEDVKERLLNKSDDRVWICCPKWDLEENKQREKEKERKRAEREQQEEYSRKYKERRDKIIQSHKSLIQEWKTLCNAELTNRIITKIRENPFGNKEESISICEYLLPYGNFEEFIKTSPLNRYGLEVFYTLLNYYKNTLRTFPLNIKEMLSLGYQKENVEESRIAIEEIVSMHIVAIVWDKELAQNYIKQSQVRDTILNILSFYYHRILASNVNSYQQLAEDLMQSNPELMWCLQAFIEYNNKKNKNPHILLNSDIFRKIKEIADTNNKNQNSAIQKILLCVYKRVFCADEFITTNTDIPQIPLSISAEHHNYLGETYHEMTWAEETAAFKELNEKYK